MLRGSKGSLSFGGVRRIILALALTIVLVVVPTKAHAYTDPGSGALIWQGLLAAFFGGFFYARRFVQALRRRFTTEASPEIPKEPSEARQ